MIPGKLLAFFETGTEGVIWSCERDGLTGYDSLHCFENGDFLRVLGDDGGVLFEGEVALEYKRRWRPYPLNPSLGQQEVHGFWVRGLQEEVEPESWSHWFHSRLRCEYRPLARVHVKLPVLVHFDKGIERELTAGMDMFEQRAASDAAGTLAEMEREWRRWTPDDASRQEMIYRMPERVLRRASALAQSHGLAPETFLAHLIGLLITMDAPQNTPPDREGL